MAQAETLKPGTTIFSLPWRKHPLDDGGHIATFLTDDCYVCVAATRWVSGYRLGWRYLNREYSPGDMEHAITINKQVLDGWLRDIAPAPFKKIVRPPSAKVTLAGPAWSHGSVA